MKADFEHATMLVAAGVSVICGASQILDVRT